LEDKIIELADYFISENTTYREAKIACEKLLKQVSHEIELRALESETRGEPKMKEVDNRTKIIYELIHGIDLYLESVSIVGQNSLNDYGRGQYDAIFRISNALKKDKTKEKASDDA
jgi:hypothetical protein